MSAFSDNSPLIAYSGAGKESRQLQKEKRVGSYKNVTHIQYYHNIKEVAWFVHDNTSYEATKYNSTYFAGVIASKPTKLHKNS